MVRTRWNLVAAAIAAWGTVASAETIDELVDRVPAAEQANLAPNGGFEAGELEGWKADGGWTRVTEGARSGASCARVVSSDRFENLITTEFIPVIRGHEYYCRYFTRRVSGGQDLMLRVDYFRADQTPCEDYATQAAGQDGTEWKRQGRLISNDFPADTAFIKLWFHQGPDANTTTLVDDVMLLDVSPMRLGARLSELRASADKARRLLGQGQTTGRYADRWRQASEGLRAARFELDALSREPAIDGARPMTWWDERLSAIASRTASAESDGAKLAALRKAGTEAPFLVGTASSMVKVPREQPLSGELEVPVRISLGRNEYEGAQVAVVPLWADVRGVSCEVGPMGGPKGLSPEVTVNRVGYVQTGKPAYAVERVGWWPDPLLPNGAADIPKDQVGVWWITVHAPKGMAPGTYEGRVTFRAADGAERHAKLAVEVWDVTLPDKNHLQTTFVLWQHMIAQFYGWGDGASAIPEDVWKRQIEFCNRYRVGAMNVGWGWDHGAVGPAWPIREQNGTFDYSLVDTFLKTALDGHMTGISMADFPAGPYTPEYEAKLRRFLADYAGHLREKGWLDRIYLKLQDEPSPDRWPAVRQQGELVHSIDPAIKTLVTAPIRDELIGGVDIWVPLTPSYDHKWAEERRAKGEQVWWYICCGPSHPYPNYFIDYPAIDHRILFWMNWKYEVNGFLYWGLNWWADSNVTGTDGKKWPDVPWDSFSFSNFNGDGHLLYPGPDGELWSSVRLENVRDSLEDYEYLWMLSEALKAARASGPVPKPLEERATRLLAVEDDLVASPSSYTQDPARLMRARAEIARTLVELNPRKPGTG